MTTESKRKVNRKRRSPDKNMVATSRRTTRQESLPGALARAEREIARLTVTEGVNEQSHETLARLMHDLGERVKELNCLYSISNIVEKKDISLEEILQGTVDILPDAWQYPEITCSRILLEENLFQTPGFRETRWKQSQPILVKGQQIGALEIYYLEERPIKDEGPFLKEERSLINVIAERIGGIVERKRASEALRKSEEQNRAVLSAIPDLMFQIDRKGTFVSLHEGRFSDQRTFSRGLIGQSVYVLAEKGLLPRRFIEQGLIHAQQTLLTGRPQVFEQHISLDGTGRDFEIRMVQSRENEVMGMVREVTQRKRLEREILEISGREQRRIGQDLHDSLCQHLAGVGFLGKVLEKKISNGVRVAAEEAGEIVRLIDEAITLTRGFARGLNPVTLEAEAFMVALSELAANTERLFGIRCRFECGRPILIDDNIVATHLYRIVQEALNNSIKHGRADEVIIRLDTDGRTNTLVVKDNGHGFVSGATQGKGMGLNIMRYRASMISASLDIRGDDERGTVLTCSFPNRNDG
jgi:signal transduction histidine kinase